MTEDTGNQIAKTDAKAVTSFAGIAEEFTAALKRHDQRVVGQMKLLPLKSLDQFIKAVNFSLMPSTDQHAVSTAKLMLGSYPRAKVDDEAVYVRAISSVFQGIPADIAAKAVDQITRSSRFLPTRAEVHAACQELLTERRAMLQAARWQIEEHQRRKVEAGRAATIEQDQAEFRRKHGGKSPLEVLRGGNTSPEREDEDGK